MLELSGQRLEFKLLSCPQIRHVTFRESLDLHESVSTSQHRGFGLTSIMALLQDIALEEKGLGSYVSLEN